MNQSWIYHLDLDDGSYVIQNGEVFREEPGGTYTPIGKVKTVPPQRGPAQCNGSNCFPPKVSAFSPAAFSDSFPV